MIQRPKRGPCFAGRPLIAPSAAGTLPEPEQPLFVFDHELAELERAFYRHLRGTVDLDALFELEQLLWSTLQEQDMLSDDQVLDVSNAILARSLERLANDPLRSMRPATMGPGGQPVDAPEAPHGECPFCGPWERGDHRGPEAGPAQEAAS